MRLTDLTTQEIDKLTDRLYNKYGYDFSLDILQLLQGHDYLDKNYGQLK